MWLKLVFVVLLKNSVQIEEFLKILFHLAGNFVRHICTLLERKLGFGSKMLNNKNNKDMSMHLDCDTDNPHPTSQGELLTENVHVNDGKSTGEKEDESFASGIK